MVSRLQNKKQKAAKLGFFAGFHNNAYIAVSRYNYEVTKTRREAINLVHSYTRRMPGAKLKVYITNDKGETHRYNCKGNCSCHYIKLNQ